MTNSIHFKSEIDRREWFRRRVAEIGALLLRLPAARREIALKVIRGAADNELITGLPTADGTHNKGV